MANLSLDWIQLAGVVGALQGVLLAAVLFAQRSNRTANRLLAVLVVALTIFLASTVYFSTELIRVYPHFFGVAYQTPWIFGQLMYLYAVAASDRAWRLGRPDALHFLPVLISIAAWLPYYVMSGPEKIALWERMRTGDVPGVIPFIDPFKYVLGIAYSVVTVLYVRRHRRRVEDSYSNTERVNLQWLSWLTGATAAIWLLAVGLKLGGVQSPVRDEHISLAMALLIYAIGYRGLRQPEIFRYATAEHRVPKVADNFLVPPEVESSSARYQRSGLGQQEAEALKESLLQVMEADRPWKDSDLTLADLASRLDSTPHKLSEVLNSQVGQTFYDFVNGYRVRDVQRRIEAGEARRLKILALALDSGFASKSTFNEAFKRHTSRTPSDFRQAVGA